LIRRVAAERGVVVEAVGGLTMGADPVALAVAIASGREGAGGPLHAFAVRKTAKSHGLGRLVEGNFAAGQTVVVVDDVITTGVHAAGDRRHREGRRESGVRDGAGRPRGRRPGGNIEARGVPVYALATKSQLRDVKA
jgi:orotate phosphoribosyltransferase